MGRRQPAPAATGPTLAGSVGGRLRALRPRAPGNCLAVFPLNTLRVHAGRVLLQYEEKMAPPEMVALLFWNKLPAAQAPGAKP